jgi:hypothetical protein
VLIVAHNEIGKMIRASFENRHWEQELYQPPLDYCQLLVFHDKTRTAEATPDRP